MASTPPGQAPYRELTIASVVFGVLVGCLMTASFVYIALKLGFGLGGSTVAAILGFAVLRGALRKGSIIKNNINQTVASGVNNASAGIAFTFPALFLLREAGVIEAFFGPLSVGERPLNRAWAAAPDLHWPESFASVKAAEESLRAAQAEVPTA